MLAGHLVVGVVAGGLAALASGLMGFSVGATVGFYILGANLGLGLSALGALVPRRKADPRGPAALETVLMSTRTLPPAE